MTHVILDLAGTRTPLYPLTRAHLLELERPISTRLEVWRMFPAQNQLEITNFYGKPISYRGIRYEGSPEQVFWAGLFEPFMIDAAKTLFQWVIDHCNSQKLEPAAYLAEARDLLRVFVVKTYREMVEADRVLRGRGFPESVVPRRVDHKIKGMHVNIDDLLLAMTHSGKGTLEDQPKSSGILKLEPNIYGIGLNLSALWQWIRKKVGF